MSIGSSAIADALIRDPFSRTDNPRVWAILVGKMIDSLDELQDLCKSGDAPPMKVLAKLDDIRQNMPKGMTDRLLWRTSSAMLMDEGLQLQECDRRSKQLTEVMGKFLNRELGGEADAYLDAFLKYGQEEEGLPSSTERGETSYNSPEFWEGQFVFMKVVFPLWLIACGVMVFGIGLYSYPVILSVVAGSLAISLAIIGIRGKLLAHPEFESASEWLLGVPLVSIFKLFSPILWAVSLVISLLFWGIQRLV